MMILEVNLLSWKLVILNDYMEINTYFEILAWWQTFSSTS